MLSQQMTAVSTGSTAPGPSLHKATTDPEGILTQHLPDQAPCQILDMLAPGSSSKGPGKQINTTTAFLKTK